MKKFKILEKLRIQKKESMNKKDEPSKLESNEMVQSDNENDSKEPSITEYHETLYSEGVSYETNNSYQNDNKIPSDQRIWRDVKAIEENVDNISKNKSELHGTDLEKRVDGILSKSKERKSRKPSNVIYVVSKPQPGQVKGDWAVRSHGKIYSHHRKKENAIKKARNIARERNATVLIQNTDGTFSDGFKPRSKK